MTDYSKEQLWELYKALPKNLQDTIFSEKVADIIRDVCCNKNKLKEEKMSEVAKYTGYVLLGLVQPSEFQKTLEKEAGLRQTTAKKIAQEISNLVFSPVKKSLEALYGLGAKTIPETFKETPGPQKPKKDKYREPIE